MEVEGLAWHRRRRWREGEEEVASQAARPSSRRQAVSVSTAGPGEGRATQLLSRPRSPSLSRLSHAPAHAHHAARLMRVPGRAEGVAGGGGAATRRGERPVGHRDTQHV